MMMKKFEILYRPPLNSRNALKEKCAPLEKWWPDTKELITSFVQRKMGDELIIEKMKNMMQHTGIDGTAVVITEIVKSGLGGVGKTTIAKWFAQEYQQEYSHIFWIDFGGGKGVQWTTELACRLNIPILNNEDKPLRIQFITMDLFEIYENIKCLFILDNVSSFKIIEDFISGNPLHHTVITSREQDWDSEDECVQIHVLHLDVFSIEEAKLFMKNGLKVELLLNEEDIALRIAKQLGYLPLALQIAVSTMNEMEEKPSQYLEHLDYINHSNNNIGANNLEGHEKAVSDTFTLSINAISKLTNGGRGELATDILNMLCFLSPDSINVDLIYILTEKSNDEVDLTLDILVKHSLLMVDTNGVYKIHFLLQKVIRFRIQSKESELLSRILFQMLNENRFEEKYKHNFWGIWNQAVKYPEIINNLHTVFISVVQERSKTYRLEDSMDFFNNAFPHIERIIGKTHLITIQMKFDLAENLFRLDEFEACKKIWKDVFTDLYQPMDILTNYRLLVIPLTPSEVAVRQIYLEAAQFNICIADQEKAMEDIVAFDIIGVQFTESILERFCRRIIQSVNLGKGLEAFKLWTTEGQNLIFMFGNCNQIRPLANMLMTLLIQNKHSREASVLYNGLYGGLFSDPILFENISIDDLKLPVRLNSGLVQNFSLEFRKKADVKQATEYYIKMTILLEQGQKLETCETECDDVSPENCIPIDTPETGFSVIGLNFENMEMFRKFNSGIESGLLTRIHLKFVLFFKCELIAALVDCTQLENLVFEDVKMIGGCRNKIYLPKLKIFVLRLKDSELWRTLMDKHQLTSILNSLSFFYQDFQKKYSEFDHRNYLKFGRFEIAIGTAIKIKLSRDAAECILDHYNLRQNFNFQPTNLTLNSCNVFQNNTIAQFGNSLKHLIYLSTTFVAGDKKTGTGLNSLLKQCPNLKTIHISSDQNSILSLKIESLPRNLTKLTLLRVEIDTTSQKSLNEPSQQFESLTVLNLSDITLTVARNKAEIELCSTMLKYFPNLEILYLCIKNASIKIDNLPVKLKTMVVTTTKLLYSINSEDETADGRVVDSNSPTIGKAQLNSIMLCDVISLPKESEIHQLFGSCKNVILNKSSDNISSSFLDRLMEIDTMELICLTNIKRKYLGKYFIWLEQFGISVTTEKFCLKRHNADTSNNRSGNKRTWEGRNIDNDEYSALVRAIFPLK